jgi:hypothetical protein
VLTTTPLAYWPLNEFSGSTVYDQVEEYDGTYTGPLLATINAPGRTRAPYFDGLNDRADMQPAALQAALSRSEFSMMAWKFSTSGSTTPTGRT